ncbi:inositol-tetrakisphosphate 1-kinase-like [Oppia nitens]|uniref:inositol-tetrakisphosphate 1-kinase-like n=1 Tax=Oppia nitens TaxID=1686743 RepID=UPI0023DC4798|nr:inositol-tetrakisphosphate 1-kinase-like [Oppia nitens]
MSKTIMSSNKVGFWASEKKCLKINVSELDKNFAAKGFELVKMNLNEPIETQGPFAAIIHKLADVMVRAQQDDPLARKQIQLFEDYINNHPEVVILDPLDNVRKLLDRYRQYKLIDDSELAREDGVFTPTFVELTSNDVNENLNKLKAAVVSFPFVCKPLVAHGSTYAHQMSIIFGKSGLKTISPHCVAQSFINHNARLFKLFLIKDKYYVIERPSLKNFKRGDTDCETVFFDSHDISKPDSCCALTELDPTDQSCQPIRDPEMERLDRIVKVVSQKVGLTLLGIDVIIDNMTGRYAIIDMNAFPGYDGVDCFLQTLCDITVEEIEKKRQSLGLTNIINELSARNERNDYLETQTKTQCLSLQSNSDKDCNNTQLKSPMIDNKSIDERISLVKTSSVEKNDKTVITKTAQNGNDFDSGIDTSDSCDEKKYKKQSQVKVVRRQHSRSLTNSSNVRIDEINSI